MKQREIKLRALCLVDCKEGDNITKMVYFTQLECDNGLWFNPDDGDIYHINEYLSSFMQFTGLTDKNGVEIYENDIAETKYQYKAQVIWHNDFACFGYKTIREEIEGEYQFYSKTEDIEVIGNIHQNKDLLK